jgi:hypothetical protein
MEWISTVIILRKVVVIPVVRSADIVCESFTLIDVIWVQVLKTAIVAPAKRLVVGQALEVSIVGHQETVIISNDPEDEGAGVLLGLWVLLIIDIPEAVQCFVGTFI